MFENNTQTLNNLFLRLGRLKGQDDFNLFFFDFLEWLFVQASFEKDSAINEKLRLFFYKLEKDPKVLEACLVAFKIYLKPFDLFSFFATTGLTSHSGILSEFSDRFFHKFLIHNPENLDLHHYLEHSMLSRENNFWLNEITDETYEKLKNFISKIYDDTHLTESLDEAITYLITEFSSAGLNPKIQKRYFEEKITQGPFLKLSGKWIALLRSQDIKNTKVQDEIELELIDTLSHAKQSIEKIPALYANRGVDTDIVFKVQKLFFLHKRISMLIKLKMGNVAKDEMLELFKNIFDSYTEQNKLRNFYINHTIAVAKQVLAINAKNAYDYIAKNKADLYKLLKKSIGGGVLTALTVILKFLITKTGLTGFWHGFFQMINYSISFLLIHYLHLTLATKQPSSTASEIAGKILKIETLEETKEVIAQMKMILKSQLVSVFGNLVAVIPSCLIFAYSYYFIFDHHFLDIEKSLYTVNSLKFFGLVPLFAIFTGVLLWSTGLIGGWVSNFLILYDIEEIFKKRFRFSKYLSELPALASNTYLGFVLGVLPEIFKFMAVPLDVRHITLSAGMLTLALASLGLDHFNAIGILNLSLGLMVIAFFNIATSFYLTLKLAYRASGLPSEKVRRINKALVLSFFQTLKK